MTMLKTIIGAVLLFSGSQLYWLTSAEITFLIASYLLSEYYFFPSEMHWITYSLAAATLGMLAGLALKRWAVTIAGFAAGAYLTQLLPGILGWNNIQVSSGAVVFAGAITAFLVFSYYPVASLLMTTILGAAVILENFTWLPLSPRLSFAILLVLGIIFQVVLMTYSKASPEESEKDREYD